MSKVEKLQTGIVGPDGESVEGDSKEEKENDVHVASMLPEPSGYRILCAIPKLETEYEGGILKADETIKVEGIMTTVLFVLKMGPDCYADETRFPSGPYCKVGDFVLVRAHAGNKLKIFGKEFRVINDDSVEGIVSDPRGISRA